jgi:hypothetical protein
LKVISWNSKRLFVADANCSGLVNMQVSSGFNEYGWTSLSFWYGESGWLDFCQPYYLASAGFVQWLSR